MKKQKTFIGEAGHWGRQGDVKIEKIRSLPLVDLTATKNKILVDGEVTGHAHRVDSGAEVLLDQARGIIYLKVAEQAIISHEEHPAVDLPAGIYRISRQREYDPWEGVRNVLD